MSIEEIEEAIKNATKDRDKQYWLGRKHSFADQQQKIDQLEREVERLENKLINKVSFDIVHENKDCYSCKLMGIGESCSKCTIKFLKKENKELKEAIKKTSLANEDLGAYGNGWEDCIKYLNRLVKTK